MTEPQAKATPAKRLTAAQRRAQEAEQRQAKEAAFETNRDVIWLKIWSIALRLELLIQDEPNVREEYSWFFEYFRVDVHKEVVYLEGASYSQAEMTLDKAERALSELEQGLEYYQSYLDEQERLRKLAEEKEARRQAALAKLTKEDREALGIR